MSDPAAPDPEPRPLVAIVDDEPSGRTLMVRVIERRLGLRTITGEDGRAAVALRFGTPEPDALIVNGSMPNMTGPEALDVIRDRERGEGLAALPIALASGWDNVEDIAREHGADASIHYPFDAEAFVQMVTDLLALGVARGR